MALVFSTYFDRLDPDQTKKSKKFITKSGTAFVPQYEYRSVDGITTLVQCGESNLDELIQSYAAEADINNIIARFLNGDDSVLNKSVGQFGDFTNVPSTYAELFDRVHQCQSLFDTLPAEIKKSFDNSYQKFWSDFGTAHFDDVFNSYNESLNVYTGKPVDSSDIPIAPVADGKETLPNA